MKTKTYKYKNAISLLFAVCVSIGACNAVLSDELNATSGDVIEKFNTAVATTNKSMIANLIKSRQISYADAMNRVKGQRYLNIQAVIARSAQYETNNILIAEALSRINYSTVQNDEFDDIFRLIFTQGFEQYSNFMQEVDRLYAENPIYGTQCYIKILFNILYNGLFNGKRFSNVHDIVIQKTANAYKSTKSIIKKSLPSSTCMLDYINYAIYSRDYDGFASLYDKKFLNIPYWKLTAIVYTSRPDCSQYMNDLLDVCKNMLKEPHSTTAYKQIEDSILKCASKIDDRLNTKQTTHDIIDILHTTQSKVYAACYCNDIDKLIDVTIKCDETLDPSSIDKIILMFNTLDPDYRLTDVCKALKAINQRYTLKLYDDHESWEPVLSKIRAMIDIRK